MRPRLDLLDWCLIAAALVALMLAIKPDAGMWIDLIRATPQDAYGRDNRL